VTVKRVDVIGDDLLEQSWKLYSDAFAELADRAANRHLMYRSEFDAVMADERITKFLILDDAGLLAGIITWTAHLDAVPLIAPEYYARRWPQHFEQGRIFYILFFATAPEARKSRAFVEGFADLFSIAEPVDGLVALDVCTFNETVHHLPQNILNLLRRMSGDRSRAERSDAQVFWTFDMRGDTLQEAA
jgi:hypothetical protein